jgi:hypothetical protein
MCEPLINCWIVGVHHINIPLTTMASPVLEVRSGGNARLLNSPPRPPNSNTMLRNFDDVIDDDYDNPTD